MIQKPTVELTSNESLQQLNKALLQIQETFANDVNGGLALLNSHFSNEFTKSVQLIKSTALAIKESKNLTASNFTSVLKAEMQPRLHFLADNLNTLCSIAESVLQFQTQHPDLIHDEMDYIEALEIMRQYQSTTGTNDTNSADGAISENAITLNIQNHITNVLNFTINAPEKNGIRENIGLYSSLITISAHFSLLLAGDANELAGQIQERIHSLLDTLENALLTCNFELNFLNDGIQELINLFF